MIVEPNCNKRNCAHFIGIKSDDGVELNERPYCKAFPDGIPEQIAYGKDKHLTPVEGQENDIVYKNLKTNNHS